MATTEATTLNETLNETANTPAIPDLGQALASAATLVLTATLAFGKGMLLGGLLNLIPLLPAYQRSTASLMNRAFALFLFAPAGTFILAAFPLLAIAGYRSKAVSFCAWAIHWYGKTDLR